MKNYQLRPSRNFTERTMARIVAADRQRRFLLDLAVPLLVFSPLVLRQIWLWFFYQRDLVSVGSLPLHDYILPSYTFLVSVSSLAVYGLFALGTAMVAVYFWRVQRFGYIFRTIGQFSFINRFRS